MAYFVIAHDGGRYGPADVADLQQWVREGRLAPTSILEHAITHERMTAASVPGVFSGEAPPGYPQSGYYARNPYGGPMPAADGAPYAIAAWVCGSIGLLFCPIVLSSLGIVFGIVGYTRGTRHGLYAAIFSVATLIGGMLLGYWAAQNLGRLAF